MYFVYLVNRKWIDLAIYCCSWGTNANACLKCEGFSGHYAYQQKQS